MAEANNEAQSVPHSSRSAAQVLEDLLDESRTPLLWQLVQGARGHEYRVELTRLVKVFVPDRAPREQVKVVGKIVRDVGGTTVEDAVVVRDISETGVQLAVSKHLGMSAADLTDVRLRLRLPGGQDTVATAHLVRVVKSDKNFIQAGFRFTRLEESAREALHQIRNVQSFRTAAIVRQMRSQPAPLTRQAADVLPPSATEKP